jgi:hypothetical protein
MERSLDAYLAREVPPAEFAVHYRIGDEFSGETEFRLWGDGRYDLRSTVTPGRATRTFAGQAEAAEVEELVRALKEARIWEATHVRTKPGEDDPEASIAVEGAGQEERVALWVSEIRESPPFARAQQALLALIRRLSGGEVLEGGQ